MVAPDEASQTRAVPSKLAVMMRCPSGLNAASTTMFSCLMGGETGCPVAAFQTCAVLSSLAVTMRRPSGLNAACLAAPSCFMGDEIGSAVAASQTRAVLSGHAVTTRCPSGLKAACHTAPSCFMGGEMGSPVAVSQTLRGVVFAGGYDASSIGAERLAIHVALVHHGASVRGFAVAASQTCAVWAALAVTMRRPSGLNAVPPYLALVPHGR